MHFSLWFQIITIPYSTSITALIFNITITINYKLLHDNGSNWRTIFFVCDEIELFEHIENGKTLLQIITVPDQYIVLSSSTIYYYITRNASINIAKFHCLIRFCLFSSWRWLLILNATEKLNKCDMIKGNESLVLKFQFLFLRNFLITSKCKIWMQTPLNNDIWLQSYDEFVNA